LLTELSIRDLALIPRLTVRFGPGLNVFSGETGAGKSLVVGSLRLLCGERPPPDIVRTGADRAVVEGIFELEAGGWIAGQLAELGIDVEDGELILRREIVAEGRGRVRANGNAITLGTLAAASELLVDLHGQHDHQSLLRPSYQLDALDDYAGLFGARNAFAADANLLYWFEGQGILKLYNRLHLAYALEKAGHEEEARQVIARVEAVNPEFAHAYSAIKSVLGEGC